MMYLSQCDWMLNVILLLPFVNSDQVKYSVQTNNVTWKEASLACSLATPTLNFPKNKTYTVDKNKIYTVDFNNSNIQQLDKGETYWIGYQMGYKTFKYEGCSPLSSDLTYDYRLAPIPGHCFTACSVMMKSKYYGLRRTKNESEGIAECYCLADKPTDLLQTECTRKCIQNPQHATISCGGDKLLSIYSSIGDDFVSTKVKNHTIEKSVRHCVTYKNVNITSYEWYWTSCETRLHPLCEQAPAEVQARKRRLQVEDDNLNWKKSGLHCLNKTMHPSAIIYEERDEYESLNVSSPSWTALFREQCVYVPGQVSNLSLQEVQCASITIGEENQPKLYFRDCLGAETFGYICQEGITPKTTIKSSTTESAISSTADAGDTISTDVPSTISLDDEEPSLVVPIVVGAVCGILVIIAVIVVIVCVRQRSERKHQEAETKSIPELEHYTHCIRNDDYAVVDKQRNRTGATNDVENRSAAISSGNTNSSDSILGNSLTSGYPTVPIRTSGFDDDDYYDHTSSNRKDPSFDKAYNVYNKLNVKDDVETHNIQCIYDTSKKQNIKESSDLYNKLESLNRSNMYYKTDTSKEDTLADANLYEDNM